MSFKQQIDKVNQAKNPTPTDNYEQNEHNDMNRALRAKHNGQSYKTFANPTNDGKEKENHLDKGGLTVKPLIEIHKTPPNKNKILRNALLHFILYNFEGILSTDL